MLHIAPEGLRRRMDPWMSHVWHSVKLQHDNLPIVCLLQDVQKMLKGPIRVAVGRSGNQKRVVSFDVERRADNNLAVLHFGGSPTPRQTNAGVTNNLQSFGS